MHMSILLCAGTPVKLGASTSKDPRHTATLCHAIKAPAVDSKPGSVSMTEVVFTAPPAAGAPQQRGSRPQYQKDMM